MKKQVNVQCQSECLKTFGTLMRHVTKTFESIHVKTDLAGDIREKG
jgi:hypothetical protein